MPNIIELAGRLRTSQKNVTVAAASGDLVAENPFRATLTICPPSSGYVTISLLATAVLDQGIRVDSGDDPVVLTVGRDGDLPLRGWSVIHSVGADVVTVLESVAPFSLRQPGSDYA